MDCTYCQKSFSTKGSLAIHQKTAKFCLKLQGKNEESSFICSNCNKAFTQKISLSDHLDVCKERYKKLLDQKEDEYSLIIKKLELEITKIKRLEKEKVKEKEALFAKDIDSLKEKLREKEALFAKDIDSLTEKLKEKNDYIVKLETKLEKFENVVTNMASATTQALEVKTAKASTTNNTTLNTNITVNNVLNLSQEHVKKVLEERLDYNVVYAGQAGLAMFVFNNILKDATGKLIYRCVDASRQMFEFVDENGETVRDMKAEKLTQSLLKGDVIKLGLEAAAVGWNTENEKLNTERVGVFGPKVNEYADLNRNNTVFRAKVSSLTA